MLVAVAMFTILAMAALAIANRNIPLLKPLVAVMLTVVPTTAISFVLSSPEQG